MSSGKNINKKKGRVVSALSFLSANLDVLKNDCFLKEVYSASRKQRSSVFLVGGFVRNLALEQAASPDYDFVVSGDVKKISEETARRLGGTAFVLDKETPSYRIVIKNSGPQTVIDFSPIKEGGIKYDLLKRDFTVNAMAVDVRSVFEEGVAAFLDPSNGLKDAKALRLKAVLKDAFNDDPLRCLRAIRLSVQYGLTISKATLALIKKSARGLETVSAERIREELIAVFSSDNAAEGVRLLYALGIIDVIAPELSGWDNVKGYDLLRHSLKTLEEARKLLNSLDRISAEHHERLLARYLKYDGPTRHDTFFIISAFLHDIGKPAVISRESGRLRFIGHDNKGEGTAKEMLMRLRFSKRFSAAVALMVKNHHRLFMLAKLPQRTFKAKAHFFRSVGGDAGVDLILLSLVDARATINGEDEKLLALAKEMIDFYYTGYIVKKPKPLMSGEEIMKAFKLKQGKIIGEIMNKLNEGVEKGSINSKKDAIKYVKSWLKDKT